MFSEINDSDSKSVSYLIDDFDYSAGSSTFGKSKYLFYWPIDGSTGSAFALTVSY